MSAREWKRPHPSRSRDAIWHEVPRSEREIPVRVSPRRFPARSLEGEEIQERWLGWIRPAQFAKALVLATTITIAMGTVYYYNLFISLDQDVHTSLAQIDRELQRRVDLIETLLPPAFEYAALERQIFTDVAKLRARPSGTPAALEEILKAAPVAGESVLPPSGLNEVLGRLLAVSEQYPDMKSNTPFQLLMENLVEIENRLADERRKYNDQVNFYTTKTASFPGKIFAELFEFDEHALFTAEPRARRAPIVDWPLSGRRTASCEKPEACDLPPGPEPEREAPVQEGAEREEVDHGAPE